MLRLAKAIGKTMILTGISYGVISALLARRFGRPKRRFMYGVGPWLYGLETRDVVFPASVDGTRISAWFVPNRGARRAVVLVHGKDVSRGMELAGRFLELAQALHQRGFAVLMPDLRGHGLSGAGSYSFGLRERRDVTGAVAWLQAQGFTRGAIGLLGVSLGSAAVLGAAADGAGVGAVVSDSGFARIEPIIRANWKNETRLPDFLMPGMLLMARMIYGYDLAASAPMDEVWRIDAPLLLLHGGQDTLIPPEHAQMLRAAAPNAELVIIPEAPHAGLYGVDPAAYIGRVADFFDRHLGLMTKPAPI